MFYNAINYIVILDHTIEYYKIMKDLKYFN